MNHRVFGKKLSRRTNDRKRLRNGLVRDLILHGSIATTHAKAQAARGLFEKLVTQAKRNSSADQKEIRKVITDRNTYVRLTDNIVKSLKDRKSGFTRIYHLNVRRGDNAEMVRLEIVAGNVPAEPAATGAKISVVKKQKSVTKTKSATGVKKPVPEKTLKSQGRRKKTE